MLNNLKLDKTKKLLLIILKERKYNLNKKMYQETQLRPRSISVYEEPLLDDRSKLISISHKLNDLEKENISLNKQNQEVENLSLLSPTIMLNRPSTIASMYPNKSKSKFSTLGKSNDL